ncbi:MAG: efflux RND transporter permease subunit [Candidatus Hydrothermales bacterium]
MENIIEFLLKRKLLYLIFVTFLTFFFVFGITKLKIQGDILKALPPDEPYIKMFNEIGEEFEGNLIGMVILKGIPDVFNEKTFQKIQELTEEYKKIEGISNCLSLTDIMDIKKIEDGIEVGKLLPPNYIPKAKEEYDSLKSYVMSKERYKGVIVSEDGKYTSIIIRFSEKSDKEKTALKIREITEELKENFEIHYSGIPFVVIFVNEMIRKEIIRLIPYSLIIITLILFLSFKNFQGILLIISVVIISITWVLGLMGFLNVPLSIVSNILPVILLAVGSAYGIHLLNKYKEYEKENDGIKKSVRDMWVPIFMAAVTTFFGFLSLIFTQLDVIRKFGIFLSIGVIFALILTLTFIPVILSYNISNISLIKDFTFPPSLLLFFISKLIKKYKNIVAKLCFVILFISILGILKIKREVDMIAYFPSNNPVRVSAELVRDKFGGHASSYVVFEADNIKNPLILKLMKHTSDLLKKSQYIHNPQSIADLIAEMNELVTDFKSIPESEEKINNLYFLLEGQPQLDMIVRKDGKKATIQMVSELGKTKIIREVADYIESVVKRFSGKYLMIDQNTLDHNKREKVFKKYTKFYTKTICEVFNIEDSTKIYETLYSYSDESKFKKYVEEVSFGKLEEYFKSEEAYIVILDKKLREKVIRDILKENDIKGVLIKYFKNKREDIEEAALELEEILKESKRLGFINSLNFDKKIKDYIYEFTGEKWIIPYEEEFKDDGEIFNFKIYHTGVPQIYKKLDDNLLKSQMQSLLMVLILVFIFVSIEWKSITGGLITVLPIIFTTLIYFGLLGFLNYPLDAASVMIAPIIIGIGIDYSIHVISRIKKELEMGNNNIFENLLKTTGRAVFINALSVGLGLLVLVLGDLIIIKRFGILTFITMIISSLSSLILIPIFISTRKPKFLVKKSKT